MPTPFMRQIYYNVSEAELQFAIERQITVVIQSF
jgi:hypothetical protein